MKPPERVAGTSELFILSVGLRGAGVDPDAVARAAGLALALEDCSEAELTPDTFAKIWMAALELSGDVTLPALVGARVPIGAYRVIDYLAWACPTVGTAFVQLARYFRLITDQIEWTVDEDGAAPVVVCTSHRPDPMERAVSVQYTLGVTVGRFQQATVGPFVPERVELPMDPPADTSIHQQVFRCPVDYGREEAALVLSREVWDFPLAGAAPEIRDVLEQHAADLLARQNDGDALGRVRAAIRQELPQAPPKLETVAAKLAMSVRTLQRRLGEAETTFQALVEDERRTAACAYLRRRDLAVGDVAYMLGYSEPSAFARAFKRWTGVSPSDYRTAPSL